MFTKEINLGDHLTSVKFNSMFWVSQQKLFSLPSTQPV